MTEIGAVIPYLPRVDLVLVMSVQPGFGGQKMIPYTIEKVRELKKIVDEKGYEVDIEVDGGITLENVEQFLAAGANIIVAGSSVFGGDVEENVKCFLDKLNA
jgi:ribulose-phosphate 3-epimerase